METSTSPSPATVFLFLHTVPFMAAIALAPHARKMRETLRYGLLDFLLLTLIWFYVYVFAAMPWKRLIPTPRCSARAIWKPTWWKISSSSPDSAYLFFRAHGGWKKIYGHLFGAFTLYVAGFVIAHTAVGRGRPIRAAFSSCL